MMSWNASRGLLIDYGQFRDEDERHSPIQQVER